MASKDLTRGDDQGELALSHALPNEVPIEMIRRQKNGAAALCLAIQSSGLEDKEIYIPLGVDAGYWTRIKKGEATLQVDLIEPFCDLVANRIYPEWIAYRVSCTLVQIKSDAERRAENAERRAQEAEQKLKWAMEIMHGKVPA